MGGFLTFIAHPKNVQAYARAAGLLGLVSLVAGGFGEAYVPGVLVSHDALAAGANIAASELLFRLGFTAYLIEALCDVGLTFVFYFLLWPAGKGVALLSVFFRLMATTGFAVAQVFYFVALPVARNAGSESPGQPSELLSYTLTLNSYGQAVFMMFYGVGALLLGYLIYRSDFLPRVIGVAVALSGLGFISKTFTWALSPTYSSPLLLVPAGIAALLLTVWLLVRGVDVAKWQEKANRAAA